MKDENREARILGVVTVAAFAGVAMAAYSAVIATQPQQARPAAIAVLPVQAADAQTAPAFVMPVVITAQADGQVFEYY